MLYGIKGTTEAGVVDSFHNKFPHLKVIGEARPTMDGGQVILTARVKSLEDGREYPEFGIGALTGHPGPSGWMGSTTTSDEVRCWAADGKCGCLDSGLVPERACEGCKFAEFRFGDE